MSGLFTGETMARTLARAFLFSLVLTRWKLFGCPDGRALFMGGHGGDARPWRGIGGRTSSAIVVDKKPDMIARCRGPWDGADLRLDSVENVLHSLPDTSLAFSFLDFCGLADSAVPAVEAASDKLRLNALLAVTYQRARENDICQARMKREAEAELHFHRARGDVAWPVCPRTPPYRRQQETHRAIYGINTLGRALMRGMHRHAKLRGTPLEIWDVPVLCIRYQGASPMEIVVFQRARRSDPRIRPAPNTVVVQAKTPRPLALRLARQGIASSRIEDLLHLDAGTLAAWKAHETRGTYDDNNEVAP